MILPQRYILSILVKTTLAMVAAVVGVACLARSLVFMDFIVNHGLSVGIYFYIMLLTMPMLMMGLLPLAGFASVMFVYTKLSVDNELIVLRAAGMSIAALAAPAAIMAGILMAACLAMTTYLMPRTFAEFKDIEFFLKTRMASMTIKEGEFNRLGPRITIYVRARIGEGDMTGILVQDDRDPKHSKTLIAERARFTRKGDVYKVLFNSGNVQDFDRETRKVSVIHFAEHIMELDTRELDAGGIRERGLAERSIQELLNPPSTTPRDRELFNRSLAEGHQRLAFPVLCLTYVAIALASLLAGPFDRRGAPWRLATACGAVVAVQGMNILLASAASRAPILLPAIHMNTILPCIAAVALLAYRDRRLPRGRLAAWFHRLPIPTPTGRREPA